MGKAEIIGGLVLTGAGLLGLSLAISGVLGGNARVAGGIVATLILLTGLVRMVKGGNDA